MEFWLVFHSKLLIMKICINDHFMIGTELNLNHSTMISLKGFHMNNFEKNHGEPFPV